MPKFYITAPRYINGEYIAASPNSPAIIDVPENPKDKGLIPVEKGAPETPKHHFAPSVNGPQHATNAPKAAEVFGEVKGEAGRASNKKVI